MSYKKIFWGAILILIGILIILKNVGAIYFTWWSVLRLWPVILVLWGISLIPVKDWIKLLISFLILVLSVILVANNNKASYPGFWGWSRPFHQWNRSGDDWNKPDRKKYDSADRTYQHLVEPYDTTIASAELRLDAAAGEFHISNTTEDLIDFERSGFWGDYSMTSMDSGDKQIISLTLEGGNINRPGREHKVEIKLNSLPVWDFDLDIGAAAMTMDLSGYQTRTIDIDGGATSIDLKLGDEYPETQITIDAGASSITLSIPLATGCEVNANTVLSSRNMEGFHKIRDHIFQTEDFSTATHKIYITIDAAVSSLSINRY
ncbi:MAG: DUF5668 domain-containing protein [Bacteroidales bacterium]|nr:hypothetical protein [Lentimicrobiaceae bacterium]MDD5693691.1 DUF5668 domain-containing protein [Bacteroidales bacterium]